MDSEKEHILVVDDNEMNRDMLSRRLERKGYAVDIAPGGKEALDMLEKNNYGLVMLDVMMPDVDGLTVLKHIREKHSMMELSVIMVTAKTESEDIVAALKLGANDYVVKPVNFQEALARTHTQLELIRLHRELKQAKERGGQGVLRARCREPPVAADVRALSFRRPRR